MGLGSKLVAIILLLLLVTPAKGNALAELRRHWHPTAPSPLRLTHTPFVQAYVMWVPACFFSGVLIHDLTTHRELTTAEAWTMFGNCVIPVIGGLVIKAAFDSHPEWNVPGQVHKLDMGISSQ